MKKMMIIAAVLMATVAVRADVLASWGHSTTYVTANEVLAPGSYDGAMDDTSAAPLANYTGPIFYATMQGTTASLAAQVRDQTTYGYNTPATDYVNLQTATSTSNDEYFQFSMRQAQFESGFTTGDLSVTSLSAALKRNANGTGTAQFMVQNNGTWYLSEASIALATSWANFNLNVTDSNWAVYDPTASLIPGPLSYGAMTFDKVTAFGVLAHNVYTGGTAKNVQFLVDSMEMTLLGIPAAPTNLSATVVSAYAIDLGWSDTSSSEDGFIIERGADTNSLVAIATNAANDATYSDTGLSPTTEYWYRVSAHNGAGSSTNNPVASATTDSLTGPTAPTSLSATAVGTDAIDLTWTDTSDVEDGFIIERGADTNSLAAIATNAVNDTTYSDTGLTPSTEYWYRVSTYNGIGASTGNPTAAATTLTPSGLGTVFSDDFTGADNTAITTTDWGYMDLGVEVVPGGSVVPRTAPAADIFEIRGNELYAEITPLETADSATYNKVMAAIYPESGGSPVYATIASGEKVVFEADLTDYVNNLGNMWGLNQQLKLVLSKRAGTYTDPHQAAADTNYVLIVTVHQSDNANQISVQGTYNRAGTQIATPSVNFTNSAALPLHLTMEHYSSGTTAYLVNGTLVGMLSGTALPTVHPYIWLGKFNGGGAELTAGSVTLDNVGITLADAGSAPDAASGFAASSPASGTIGLSWTDVATTELGYRLERKAGAAAYAEIAVLAANANSYTDTGLLSDGTIYGYRLTAFNGAGDSTGVETSATASSNPFVNWALSYPVLSGSKANTADYDNDGASDYREYALNGNPTNGADTGMVEATTDGTILTYIYAKRTDDNTIVYTLVDTTDLLFGQQFTNNWDGQTVGPSGVANFDSVTNTYNMTGSQRFIKLIIE